MVKITLTSLTIMATSLGLALASNCQYQLDYCGYNLLNRGQFLAVLTQARAKGNYYDDIYNELQRSGQPTDKAHIENSLFYCANGGNGAITFLSFCGNSCSNGGSDHSDWC
ncbi:hypothetical protein N7539_003093 [Penicillium diatomitis]|uniref:Uncharacterized protein n=1 Tax=Penicillium diatomitis TaxID=2819901 RepID=A0A9W9XFZ0_9EURO|nr:uncharacterized protein N7539_003093 [Penicillium diatomitis]KAJ5491526.1 hypothetical protein N7539_003093 [Penicillium diatomitis]